MDLPNPTPRDPTPPSKAIVIGTRDGGAVPQARKKRNRRREQGKRSPPRSSRERTIKRNARRRAKLKCTVATGDARIVSQQLDSITRACARDYDGVAIKRQLNGFDVVFALMVEAVSLGLREDGTFARTWAHPQSRRLATDMIFLGYESKETKFKGRVVWSICGYSVKAIGVQSTVRFCANAIYDAEGKPKGASINTLSRDIGALRAGGFLLPEEQAHSHQYDSEKLIAQGKGWCVGPQQRNPDGSLKWRRDADGSYQLDANGNRIPMRFAFNHYYIPFCPFAPMTRGRCMPGKFDHPFRSATSTGKHPTPAHAATQGGRLEDARQYARDTAAELLRAQLDARDAERTQPWEEDPAAAAAAVERIKAYSKPKPRDRPARPSQPRPERVCHWEDPERMARLIANADSDPPDRADS